MLWWPVVVRQTPPVDLGNGCGAPFLLWWPVVIRQTPPPVDLGGGGGAPFVLWLPVVIGRTLPTDLRDENGASFVLRELPNPSGALKDCFDDTRKERQSETYNTRRVSIQDKESFDVTETLSLKTTHFNQV